MNNDRRSAIIDAAKHIADCAEMIRIQRDAISDTRDEEQEAFDNRSEGWQNGDAGQEAQAGLDRLGDALDAIDQIDWAAVAAMLGEAIDRGVADMPEAAISEEEAELRRAARLPQWAKDAMSRLCDERDRAREQAKAVFPDADPERDDQIIIRDYESPFEGKALPFNRLELRGVEFTTQRGYCDGVAIRTGRGGLAVRPSSGNEIIVQKVGRG